MSYMRTLEENMRKNSPSQQQRQIESDIPFWEFLDIEFFRDECLFKFKDYYKQAPVFPLLFSKLATSSHIKQISDEINKKGPKRIFKEDWKSRSFYKNEIDAINVIYTLLDTNKKLLYIGEADKLIARLDNGHADIKGWNYYKYNVLPSELGTFRLSIEKMLIRDMASIMANK